MKHSSQKKMTVTIPEDLHYRLKTYCASHKVTIREMFISWIERGLDEEPVKA